MHYDNLGDLAFAKPSIDDVAWRTRFDTLGVRAEARERLTLAAQWLDGDTAARLPSGLFEWSFRTWYLLAGTHAGPYGATLRYDDFRRPNLPNATVPRRTLEQGNAWTLAWTWEPPASPWRLAVEASRIHSRSDDRRALGEPTLAQESRLEVSLRYRFDSRRGLE